MSPAMDKPTPTMLKVYCAHPNEAMTKNKEGNRVCGICTIVFDPYGRLYEVVIGYVEETK